MQACVKAPGEIDLKYQIKKFVFLFKCKEKFYFPIMIILRVNYSSSGTILTRNIAGNHTSIVDRVGT